MRVEIIKKLTMRTMLALSLFLIPTGMVLHANEMASMWSRLYETSSTNEQRYQIMLNMVELDSRDLGPVYLEALNEQLRGYQNISQTTERFAANQLIILILRELGQQRVGESADAVWNMLEINPQVNVMREAVRTLGRIDATQYAGQLAVMLRNMNLQVSPLDERREIESVALATVIALERLREPVGFEPVFFAANSWYSTQSGVRATARDALPEIINDPTDILMDITRSTTSIEVKELALRVGLDSTASETDKAEFAAQALEHALSVSPRTRIEERALKSLRMNALAALRDLDEKADRAVPSMARMLIRYQSDSLYDQDEMLALINAMGTFSNDDSVRALSGFMRYQTERRERGLTSDNLRIPRATIIALGNTGNVIAIEDLNMVVYSNQWESVVRRDAQAALDRIMDE
ncbi:MAG: PBS lyase [Spirochaeta sp.]|nr:PBS lyase [Spirochaeta sp.]